MGSGKYSHLYPYADVFLCLQQFVIFVVAYSGIFVLHIPNSIKYLIASNAEKKVCI